MSSLLIKLFIKDSENIKDNKVREAYGTLGSIFGIVCNLFLCIIKLTVGVISGSISILADGLNNLSDMGSSIVTIIGFKLSNKPADRDHPFGHGRMEYISAFIVSALILIVGTELFKSSATALIKNEALPKYSAVSLIVLIVSIIVKLYMYLFNRKIGKKINSEALIATAQDSVNDCIATAVILISVGISLFYKVPFNLDAVMGLLVALFILYSGISSAKNTLDQILGMPPEKELIEELKNTILSFDEFVGIHDLLVHNYGPGRQFASVHVEVPQNTDIVKCHEKVDLCEKLVGEKLNLMLVIHMDPIDTDNEIVSDTRHNLSNKIKAIHSSLSLHDFRMTPVCGDRTNLIFDVVIPSGCSISQDEIEKKIKKIAKDINSSFECVITFDNDYTGI